MNGSNQQIEPTPANDVEQELLNRRSQYLLSKINLADPPEKPPTDEELQELLASIKKAKSLEKRPYDAMLSSSSANSDVELLQCWITAAAIDHLKAGHRTLRHRSTLKNACLRIRHLHEGKNTELRDAIKDLPTDLNAIRERLAATYEKATAESQFHRQLGHLIALLKVYQTKQTRKSSTRSSNTHQPFTRHRVPTLASDSIGTATIYRKPPPDDDDEPATAETIVDIEPNSPVGHRRSLALKNHHAKTASQRLTAQRMFSPVAWGNLSEFEVQGTFKALHKGAKAGVPEDTLLLTALLTGRKVEELNSLECVPFEKRKKRESMCLVYAKDRFALRTVLKLPNPKRPSKEFDVFFRPSSPDLYLPLPPWLATVFKTRKGSTVCEEEKIRERLKEIRKSVSDRITENRIASAAFIHWHNAGHSTTDLASLFGLSPDVWIPLYYQNCSSEELLEIYHTWVTHLEKYTGSTLLPKQKVKPHRFGSRRSPTPHHVKALFAGYREIVSKSLQNGSPASAHNAFTLYSYLVMSFCTGHRPVQQPFDLLKDYCSNTHQWFIADKQSRRAPSPRIVVLPPIAVVQVQYLLKHLEALQATFGVISADHQAYLAGALTGDLPFLFFINEKTLEIEPLRPKHIQARLKSVWPIHDNWYRHFTRSELRTCGLNDEQVVCFLGHGEFGQEPFAPFSGHSIANLKLIAHGIEQLADQIGIKPLEGRK